MDNYLNKNRTEDTAISWSLLRFQSTGEGRQLMYQASHQGLSAQRNTGTGNSRDTTLS